MNAGIRKTPWSAYSGEDTNGWFVIHDANGDEIGSTDGGFEEDEARMFAAAPDLAEALDRLLSATEGFAVDIIAKQQARLALAKAGAA